MNVQHVKNDHSRERVTIDHFSATNFGFKNIVFPKLPSSSSAGKENQFANLFQFYVEDNCDIHLQYQYEFKVTSLFNQVFKVTIPIKVDNTRNDNTNDSFGPHTCNKLYFE